MEHYVDFVQRKRIPMTIFFFILTALAVTGITFIEINPDFAVFQPKDSEYKKTMDQMHDLFGTSDQTVVAVETGTTQLSAKLIKELREIQIFMEKLPGIAYINGPAPETIETDKWQIDLINELTKEDLKHLQEHFEGMGNLSPLKKTENQLIGIYSLYLKEDITQKSISQLEQFLENKKLAFSITGNSYMQGKIMQYIQQILGFVPLTALLLVLIAFRTQMKSIKATFLSILPAGIAALWTMGSIGWIGRPVSIITVLAPIFTVVIGSADGLHFISHILDARREGDGHLKSISRTLRMVGIPMIITTVTSMVGFLSLLVMNTESIRDLALFASLGILLAGVATWCVLPIILVGKMELKASSARKKAASKSAPRSEKTQQDFAFHSLKNLWGIPSAAITGLLIIFAVIGMSFLRTDFNQLSIFRDYTEVRKSVDRIKEINGGSIPVYLIIETDGDPLSPQHGSELLDLEKRLLSTSLIQKVVSIYDVYAHINAGLLDADSPVYPGTEEDVETISTLISGKNDPTAHLINREEKASRMIIFPKDLENETLDQIAEMVTSAETKQNNLHFEITGAQYLMRELNAEMTKNQTKTILLAFSVIFILLLISLKGLKPAFISLLPIVCTTFFIFGFMGAAGISLNLFTATIFSIAIGVGIDYAVHFTSVWKSYTGFGYSAVKATVKAMSYTCRPIIANALGLSLGLSALLLSPLRIHVYMSVLMWVAMVSGVFVSLSFLPTLLGGSVKGNTWKQEVP